MKPFHPPITAVVLSAYPYDTGSLVKLIDSIRKQKVLPMYVRVRDFGNWTKDDELVQKALSELALFVPDILVTPFELDGDPLDALDFISEELVQRPFHVVVLITRRMELQPDALLDLSKGFLELDAPYMVRGKARHIVFRNRWERWLWQITRRTNDLSAYRKDVLRGAMELF